MPILRENVHTFFEIITNKPDLSHKKVVFLSYPVKNNLQIYYILGSKRDNFFLNTLRSFILKQPCTLFLSILLKMY